MAMGDRAAVGGAIFLLGGNRGSAHAKQHSATAACVNSWRKQQAAQKDETLLLL